MIPFRRSTSRSPGTLKERFQMRVNTDEVLTIEDIPPEIPQTITFVPVDTIDDVVAAAFGKAARKKARRKQS